ncbi:hypothetical protein BDA96_04G150600 [Sorghum bicolor]|uniref:Uncharacterized protein n=1 Tax=Sorghum bicolor TaxID=4558 RepID=A0A921UI66_SORBI|nr:hypothetical protein BDA96_04G150600 [Sorghum bicolor]
MGPDATRCVRCSGEDYNLPECGTGRCAVSPVPNPRHRKLPTPKDLTGRTHRASGPNRAGPTAGTHTRPPPARTPPPPLRLVRRRRRAPAPLRAAGRPHAPRCRLRPHARPDAPLPPAASPCAPRRRPPAPPCAPPAASPTLRAAAIQPLRAAPPAASASLRAAGRLRLLAPAGRLRSRAQQPPTHRRPPLVRKEPNPHSARLCSPARALPACCLPTCPLASCSPPARARSAPVADARAVPAWQQPRPIVPVLL